MSEQSLILWILGAILTVTGFAGLLLPIVPGAPLLFLGLLFGAWAENFRYIGIWTLLALAGMAALTYLVEFAASVLGVKKFGGSRRAMAGAALGGREGGGQRPRNEATLRHDEPTRRRGTVGISV